MFDFTESRVLVTGASRGLGFSIAASFADAGAHVAINGRQRRCLEEARGALGRNGRPCEAIVGDVTIDCDSLVGQAVQSLGGLDILVHAAAVRDRRGTERLDTDGFANVVAANLTASYALARASLPHLRASSAGRLIFVTSIAASISRAGDPAYSAAKGGLATLTRSLAVEFGDDNLTVNAIAPGFFATEANRTLADDPGIAGFIASRVPLRRWGRPEEIAPAALFLASPAASYVNGLTLTVDGGLSAQM